MGLIKRIAAALCGLVLIAMAAVIGLLAIASWYIVVLAIVGGGLTLALGAGVVDWWQERKRLKAVRSAPPRNLR